MFTTPSFSVRSFSTLSLFLSILNAVNGQQVGTYTAETHPTMTVQQCSSDGTCTSSDAPIVLDANWRWLHETSGYTNCYTGNEWDTTICPDGETCASNCALEGADYEGTYGITTDGDALTLSFVTTTTQTNVGSRVYLMSDDTTYQTFNLLNQEFTFDVDLSALPCGLNGALYFVQMDADGGLSKFDTNKAGAAYGTGYCDSQCPHDIKFIDGVANVNNWTASATDANAGTGTYGTCCSEMDIWEANTISAAFTPHVCTVTEQTECSGTDCGDDDTGDRYAGVCDKDGCDFNSYRMGDTSFYGPGATVDTTQKMTVVTQFITDDGTDNGTLTEIKRIYIQNGVIIQNSDAAISGVNGSSITDDFCTAQKTAFDDEDYFGTLGGLATMGEAFQSGMVLAMSLWDDHTANLLWLDSDYPTTSDVTTPGVARGTCSTSSGLPSDVEANNATATVTYSNIKWGPIGSTFTDTSSTSLSSSAASTAASSAVAATSSLISVSVTSSATVDVPSSEAVAPTSTVAQYSC
ncbi:cellobiohydrolase precursor [Stereum hirsutum FP-91666 SS1]|uniref:cellobiohydrolase precursor n=1 Tax=Stereum hirsutum (strain FP-91666) TaxID=721885 RepID=UPI000444A7A9|nr:cellobiohydrolase precursor [Stereum hirsutum FP-91666 SS1]EIM81682.1 cellobiohydrolase precursor [Stereum hirsutum FP-91666 SS1]